MKAWDRKGNAGDILRCLLHSIQFNLREVILGGGGAKIFEINFCPNLITFENNFLKFFLQIYLKLYLSFYFWRGFNKFDLYSVNFFNL